MKRPDPAPRLGRGLAALFGDQAPAQVQPPPSVLPTTALVPGPFQPRTAMDPASLHELTESIRRSGVLQPILVRPHPADDGRHEIIAGERRWRAAQAAGLDEVPVLIRPLSDADAMAAALVENLQRQDLNPIEEADGYARLLNEFSLTQEQLADVVGKSRSHVANTLRLLHLPPSLRNHVSSRTLTPGHARALLSHPDGEAAANAVIARGLNVRQTEALAQRTRNPPPRPARPGLDPDTAATERELSEHLRIPVRLIRDGERTRLQLDCATADELDGIYQLLMR